MAAPGIKSAISNYNLLSREISNLESFTVILLIVNILKILKHFKNFDSMITRL